MIGQVINKKFTEYQTNNIGPINQFPSWASAELNIDVEIVTKIFNNSQVQKDFIKNLHNNIRSNYEEWSRAPVRHTTAGFVQLMSDQFNVSTTEVRKILNNASWFVDRE